jgi:periplasmic divalent cation tolerance protein
MSASAAAGSYHRVMSDPSDRSSPRPHDGAEGGVAGDGAIDVRTTVDDLETAERIARTLVEERLVACAHVTSPITSYYWWEDELQRTIEFEVVLRTTVRRAHEVCDRLLVLHPYGLPALVVCDMSTSRAYGEWIVDSTR